MHSLLGSSPGSQHVTSKSQEGDLNCTQLRMSLLQLHSFLQGTVK